MSFSSKVDTIQKRYRKQTEKPKKDNNTISWLIDQISWLREDWESSRKIRGFRGEIAEILKSEQEKRITKQIPPKKRSREDF